MTEQSPSAFVWDLTTVLANVDDNVEDLKDLLEIWLRQTPRLLSDIQNALETGDAKKLQLAAHTLKGSLQILCVQSHCFAAEALEKVGKSGQVTGGVQLLSQLEHQIAVFKPQVIEFMQTH